MVRNILRVVHRHSGDKCLVVHRHSGDECFPQWFSLGGVLEGYSAPWVASEASKVLLVRNWTSVRDVIRSTPGASIHCLGGRTGIYKYGICINKGQTTSN